MGHRAVTVLVVTDSGAPEYVAELARSDRHHPVGRVASPAAAAVVVRQRRPDVVLVEVDSFERLEALVEDPEPLQGCSVVVVSSLPAEVALLTCMAAGAAAFVGFPMEPGLLVRAVAAVTEGHTFVDPRSTDWLVRFALHGYKTRPQGGLTLRQAQVVQLVRGGLTNRQIAHALGVSSETVKSHLQEAMRRLGVHSRRNATESMDRRRNGSQDEPSRAAGNRGTAP